MTGLTPDDFDYDLPAELIAQAPLSCRQAGRLLDLTAESPADRWIADLPGLFRPGDLLVTNDTRVMHARLLGRKGSGGRVEVLVERILGGHSVLAQVRASKTPRPGSHLRLEDAFDVTVSEREGEFYRLEFPRDPLELVERHGRLPLPPYIARDAGAADELRYQTVFARESGSVAAPTAGLHFDESLLAAIRERGVSIASVTLHVGAGTFQPVRVQRLEDHTMHAERYAIPAATVQAVRMAKSQGRRVIAVGTTTLRALESAAATGDLVTGGGETRLFVVPGFRFRVVDSLLTNFHLPKSTLLMLVSAFGGLESVRNAYAHAMARRYRFFSYGDAMFLNCAEAARAF